MRELEVNNYFGFLVKEHGFIKIPEYNYVREVHNDYIKNDIVIKLIFDGDYIVEIIKLKHTDSDVLNFNKKSVELDYDDYRSYYLHDLKKLKTNSLEELSKTVKENIELLDFNIETFTIKYKVLNFFKNLF